MTWTDQCFLGVLLGSLVFLVYSLRKKRARQALKPLLNRPLAMSAGTILLFFFVIGILDSIHISMEQKNLSVGQNDSVLDYLLAPLGSFYETTYSAPMALTLFNVETVLEKGQVRQVYPRLSYIPANIRNNQDRHHRIVAIMTKATFVTVIVALLLWSFMIGIQYLYHKQHPFRLSKSSLSVLLSFSFCMLIVFASYWLSRDFHLLGTGKIGQDIFYYTIKSIRTGLVIGILTTLFMLPLALLLGIAAGYFGGLIDDIIQYLYTTLSSIPGVLLISASVLSMQTYIANHPTLFTTITQSADARLLALCVILGITSWTSLCRLLRAETLKLREIDYILAARALGSRPFTIIRKHLIPNVMHIVIINLVLDFSYLVLAEAVLSYVGVGVSPTTISWGNMINGARLELARDPVVWWPIFAAFLLMFTLVLVSNLLADAIREVYDPRLVTV